MRSTLAALFMLVTFTLAAFVANAEAKAPRTLPSVSAILPSSAPALAFDAPAGIDWQAVDTAAAANVSPRVARTVRNTPAPLAASKVWTCDAPRALASDATATVRACEYR